MIVCPRCGKENQDHYKFCLGCGAELPKDAAHAPKSFTAATPPAGAGAGVPAGAPAAPAPATGARPAGFAPAAAAAATGPSAGPAGSGAGPTFASGGPRVAGAPSGAGGAFGAPSGAGGAFGATAAAGGAPLPCPQCGTPNQPGFKFCGSCGYALAPAAAAPRPAPSGPAVASRRGSLVLIRPDGSEGDSFPLGDSTLVGREAGGLFASDSYLSPRHATFTFTSSGLTIHDEGSLNGVYLRIAAEQPTELRDGAMFRIGQEIIRFERLKTVPPKAGVEVMGSPSAGLVGRICLVIGRETTGNCYCIPAQGLHLGRERGDILFPDDGYVSGLHCRLHEEAGRMLLTDVGSSNGTFLRLMGPTPVASGSLLLMGQQLFRVEY